MHRRRSAFLCRGWALVLASVLAAGAAAAQRVELVFGSPDAPHSLRVSADGARDVPLPDKTPLGSVWKLFVYAYLADSGRQETAYRCTGRHPGEEAYCCAPGETIGRDEALAKSCGLYFAPRRLALTADAWRSYWTRQAPQAPAWLFDLDNLQPATEVSVVSLLAALAAIDGNSRQKTMAALLRVNLEPRARPLLASVGTVLRVKTWSWRDERGRRVGGFAGWLGDGTPVWLRGDGTSAQVIERAAGWLEGRLPTVAPADDACVRVRFFRRYPLSDVLVDGRPAAAGPLRGKVDALFANGQRLAFSASGDMSLRRTGGHPLIEGRFGLNDYVARVVQREGSAQPAHAARALAVAARTYLVRHAGHGGGCYQIDDDSRAQRVSPAPPDRKALAAAQWSDGLVLSGLPGRYHGVRAEPGVLSWRDAVTQADAGVRWNEILARAYGDIGFEQVGNTDAGECHALPAAESWLAGRQAAWQRRLAGMPGFELPSPPPRVCRLDHGNPYADIGRNRIYANGVGSANDRLTLAHEFLHFSLVNHPRGRDEDFVERTARELLGTP